MGNYNPHVPQILGQEWVGIRDERLEFNPLANSFERGHGFTLTTAAQVNNARFYLNTFPPNFVRNQIYTASIYPRGAEADSGPVRSVIIPCNNGTITGNGVITNGSFPVSISVYNSSANFYIFWEIGRGYTPGKCSFFFAVDSYSQLLAGKRILGVNVLTNVDVQTGSADNSSFSAENGQLEMSMSNDALNQGVLGSQAITRLPPLVTALTPAGTIRFVRAQMGDANPAFGMTGDFTTDQYNISQWTYPELQRFEASHPNRLMILLNDFSNSAYNGAQLFVSYMALEVFFCEERRVAFGSGIYMGQDRNSYLLGTNQFRVRTPGGVENPVLAAGNYTVTLSESNTGDDFLVAFNLAGGVPILNELRQLYEIPSHPGVQVNLPYPLGSEALGTTFTKESTQLLPQISLHASGGVPLVETHVYGTLAAGQVFGANTVTQTINDGVIGVNAQWPWVRYYARRFGNTTAPLRLDTLSPTVSGSGVTVQITPGEFDDLDPILDGWKEVTLRFPTPPAMGAGSLPTWRWSALGENIGSRWEVLGSAAMAVSGRASQMVSNIQFGQAPLPERLYVATYGQPVSGAAINEGWLPQLGPYVSGSAPDRSADAVLIFAQDMPTVTGFAVTTLSQPITGIGQNCGIDPCGIPTAILYNQLSWGPFGNGTYVRDIFDRAAIGWARANTGQLWADVGGTVEGNYVTTGTSGTHILDGVAAVLRVSSLSVFANNSHHRAKYKTNVVSAGASARAGFIFNMVDASNYDFVDFRFATSQMVEIVISRLVAGVLTGVTNVAVGGYGADQYWWADVDVAVDGTIRAKTWPADSPEPNFYQASLAATFPGGGVGLRSIRSAGNTNANTIISYSDYTVGPSTWNFGHLEVQRSDEITEWATIMKATSPAITGFKDFEARTGMLSSYRIRGVDVYNFPGPWSNTVSTTVASPGVSGSCLDEAHIMIFTTNERQSGYSNLAYSNAWEGQVSEDFAFAEAGFTQMQPMYDRDFFTAFRPRERGGDQFGRTVLVQAAAIDPATLPGFKALSDMAWENVSYICVRDEDGNRWFANVSVPSGVVQNRRRLYMASVQVVEVTDVPSPVDP